MMSKRFNLLPCFLETDVLDNDTIGKEDEWQPKKLKTRRRAMNKRILITGASRGLGLCFAEKYLESGDLVFAGVRELDTVSIRGLKEKYPDRYIPVVLEVSDTTSVRNAAAMVAEYTEYLDLLINNAAIHSSTSFDKLEDTDLDECLFVYDVNSIGPLRVVKEFLPLLRKGDATKIINISSESGSISCCRREKEFDYCMSKAALNMGTKLLSNYLKRDKIAVLSVHPGWMRTDMGGKHADLDPYETAGNLIALFDEINNEEYKEFIDNKGDVYPW